MKRLLRIFELSRNEQRVVLIILLIVITIAFVVYARRVDHFSVQSTASVQARGSPTPMLSQ